jgi:hypothetical protein
MAILHRIQEIRAVEHQRLRLAMARVDTKLRELEAEEKNPSQPRVPTDMFGDPIRTAEAPKMRVIVVYPLIRVWRPFEDAVFTRLDQWEEVLWPLVRRWTEGAPVGLEIQKIAADLARGREQVELHLREVRRQALFVQDVSPLMVTVYGALDLCDRAEQEEVIPALLSGSRVTADSAERGFTADDVSRNLRASFMSDEGEIDEDEDEDDKPSSPWGRLWSRFTGG